MDFATNFKRLCNEKGTSPTKVCIELGLSTNKVSLWNNGSLPKAPILKMLAEKLECTVMDFFADEEYISDNNLVLDEDERDIIRLFRLLSRKEKHDFMSKAYEYERTMSEQSQI